MEPEHPTELVNLGARPRIAQLGLCIHGAKATESFRMQDLWSLHAYFYHGTLALRGRALPFHPGCVSLCPPNVRLKWYFPANASHYYVHFALPAAPRAAARVPVLQNLGAAFDDFCRRFEEMIAMHDGHPRRAQVRLWDLLYELAEGRVTGERHTQLPPAVQVALSHVHNHLGEPLRVGELARRIGISPNYLNTLFKQSLGSTLHAFIAKARIDRALRLLARSELAVKAVAAAVGMADLQYFNKIVRRATGRSPRAYRDAARSAP